MGARRGFIERTVAGFSDALAHDVAADAGARRAGMLQSLDPRVKVVGIFALILAAVSARPLGVVLGIFSTAVVLAKVAGIPWRTLAVRAWLPVLVFTGPLALPAVFLTSGPPLGRFPLLPWPVTAPGVLAAARLFTRAEATATLALVLVLSTPWPHVLKALRVLGVPAVIVVILGMTCRYLFLLLGLARELFEARRSRLVGPLAGRERRRLATAAGGVLLGKSLHLSEEVFRAMRSRGFRGEAHALADFQMRARDRWALAAFLLAAGVSGWLGMR